MFEKEFYFSAVVCFLVLCSCGRSKATEAEQPVKTDQQPVKSTEPAKTSAVVKIVFVGQKQACKCTRERIDKSWKVLQDALEGWKDIAVERIQLDVNEERYDKLDDVKSLMVPPGLYFFDANKKLIHMIQGEVEEYQILEVLR